MGLFSVFNNPWKKFHPTCGNFLNANTPQTPQFVLEFSLEFVQLVDKITKALALKEELFFIYNITPVYSLQRYN